MFQKLRQGYMAEFMVGDPCSTICSIFDIAPILVYASAGLHEVSFNLRVRDRGRLGLGFGFEVGSV
jgi:hypothetical protein